MSQPAFVKDVNGCAADDRIVYILSFSHSRVSRDIFTCRLKSVSKLNLQPVYHFEVHLGCLIRKCKKKATANFKELSVV